MPFENYRKSFNGVSEMLSEIYRNGRYEERVKNAASFLKGCNIIRAKIFKFTLII